MPQQPADGDSGSDRVYIALGSNCGAREEMVLRALHKLEAHGAALPVAMSNLFETQAMGMGKARPFVNAVAEVAPLLSPMDLLERVKRIEREMGRTGGHYAPREIDIDIVAWGGSVAELPGLTLPHPRYSDRAFVLVPLRDVAPAFVCPVTGATIAEMIERVGTRGITRISHRRLVAYTTS